MSETLILSRRDIAETMGVGDYLEAVETGFAALARGDAISPLPMHVDGRGGAFHAKGASIRLDRLYVALKLNANFPENPALRNLPTIQGAILLCDGETGALLAVMDSIEITIRRTAAATALAARYLARPDAAALTICGCGEQGRAHLEALRPVLPLERVFAWDADPERARAFACDNGGIEMSAVDNLSEATRSSDAIVTCTTATEPFLTSDMVSAGTFVAAVGADSPSKSELDPRLFRHRVVADVTAQCVAMGDLHRAVAAGTIDADGVHAELAELVSGAKPGRASAEEVWIFDSTGTAVQDVAAAAAVYTRCIELGAGSAVALGSL